MIGEYTDIGIDLFVADKGISVIDVADEDGKVCKVNTPNSLCVSLPSPKHWVQQEHDANTNSTGTFIRCNC